MRRGGIEGRGNNDEDESQRIEANGKGSRLKSGFYGVFRLPNVALTGGLHYFNVIL